MEEEPQQPDAEPRAEPRAGRRARVILIVAAVAVVGLVGGLALRGAGTMPSGSASADPKATLDEALAAGKPVYVLVHSAT